MTAIDYLISDTKEGLDAFFDALARMPKDKQVWNPSETARNAIQIAQEVAGCLNWPQGIITHNGFDQAAFANNEADELTEVEALKALALKNYAAFAAYAKSYPESDLGKTVELPWGKKVYTHQEIFGFAAWNITYHWGQLAYLQTMYGDVEM